MDNKAKKEGAKPRKKRIDSAAEKAKIVQGATLMLTAPKSIPLSERGQVFFEEILEEQAKAQWTKHQLSFAAQLADLMDRLELMKEEVDQRGNLIDNERETRSGAVAVTTVKNPLLGEITKLAAAIVAARRSMALHARGQAGDNRKAGARRAYGRELEEGAGQDDDGLLARPN